MSPGGPLIFFPLKGFPHAFSPNFDFLLCVFLFLAVFAFWLTPGGLAWALSKAKTKSKTAIPGPSGLPLLGLVFAFNGSLTHRVLSKFSEKFKAKKLMSLSVGFTRFIVSSHPETAKEILNSSAFADRPVSETAYELLFSRAMGFSPYGEYWRNLRRISATHLFSPKRITAFAKFRQDIGLKMVTEIKGSMDTYGKVEVKKILHYGSLNNVMMSVFGKCYDFTGKCGKIDGFELEGLVSEGYELLSIFNWSDHFPMLGWLDMQGVRRRCKRLTSKVNKFVGKIIEEHRLKISDNYVGRSTEDDSSGDFVDVLLNLGEENRLSDSDMISFLWEMIFRGTDNIAILLEWILARMVLHQDIQRKLQTEIDSIVGTTRVVTDSDLPNLPYLHAIVKETLRTTPPGPLLAWARRAIHDTHIGDHFIPAGTTAMVNMWAITHDENVWAEPEKYMPERFLVEDVDIMGSDLRLAPLGSGRRVCPGKSMGLATVELWLAQLLQNFNFIPSNEGVDLSEVLKLSLEMKNPLNCKAVSRLT